MQVGFLATWVWLGGDVAVFSRNRLATSRDSVTSHSVSHAALSHATPCCLDRAFDRDSCTVLAARSTSRQRRNLSAASQRRRLSVSGERNIPARSAWTDEGRNAEIGNCARRSPVDGRRMTGMWAPRPSTIARCLDETAVENGQILSPNSVRWAYIGGKLRGQYKVGIMMMMK